MKQYLLTSLLMLLPFCGWAADEPANPKQGYAVLEGTTLTFKYGEKPEGDNVYDTDKTGTSEPGWKDHRGEITKIVFDVTYKEASPTSMYYWFQGMTKLATITGIEYLNTSAVTTMAWAFNNVNNESLTGLDLGTFDTRAVTDMRSMFEGCSNLTTILVGSNWSTSRVGDKSSGMFKGCTNLIGEAGDMIGTGKVDATRATTADGGLLTKKTVTLSPISTSAEEGDNEKYWASYYNKYVNTELPKGTKVWKVKVTTPYDSKKEITKTAIETDIKVLRSGKPVVLSFPNGGVQTLTRTFETSTDASYNPTELVGVHEKANVVPYAHQIASVSGKLGVTPVTTTTLQQTVYIKVYDVREPYVALKATSDAEDADITMTFYYDGKKKEHNNPDTHEEWYPIKPFKVATERGWHTKTSRITSVVFDEESISKTYTATTETEAEKNAITSTAYWFDGCEKLSSITRLTKLNTTLVTDMSYMFNRCGKLAGIAVDNFNTEKVTTMTHMFSGCSSLVGRRPNSENFDISNFKFTSLKDASNMFSGCSTLALIKLPSAKPETAVLENMQYMFSGCSNLTGFNNIAKLNTEKVTDMSYMFAGCTNLQATISISGFSFDSVTDMSYMFAHCKQMTSVIFPESEAKKLTTMERMFHGTGLTPFTWPGTFKTPAVKNLNNMFTDCTSLTNVDLSKMDMTSVETMSYMFSGSKLGETPTFPTAELKNLKDMSFMLSGCTSLTEFVFPKQEVEDSDPVEYEASFKTPAVQTIESMFSGCTILEKVDFTYFTSTALRNMDRAFMGCEALTTATLDKLVTDNVTNMQQLFSGCKAITQINLNNFAKARPVSLEEMFLDCESATEINLRDFNTSYTTSMKSMFKGCKAVKELILKSFNTARVTNVSQMFYDCQKLEKVEVSTTWTMAAVTDGSEMFLDASSIKGSKGTAYNDSYRDHTYARIDGGKTAPGYLSDGSTMIAPEVFALLSADKGTLTFKYDEKPTTGTVYELPTDDKPKWSENIATLRRVVFEESFAQMPEASLPTTTAKWFSGAKNLESITGIEYLNTSKVTTMAEMFRDCNRLAAVDLTHFDTENVTDMSYMFYACTNISELDFSKFKTAAVNKMDHMFTQCTNLTKLDLTSFNTAAVTDDMSLMFAECSHLTELIFSKDFTTSGASSCDNIFAGTEYIRSITFSNGLPELNTNFFKGIGKTTAPVAIYVPEGNVATIGIPEPVTISFTTNAEKMISSATLGSPLEVARYILTFKITSSATTGTVTFQALNEAKTHQAGAKSFYIGSTSYTHEFVNSDYTDLKLLQFNLSKGDDEIQNATLTKGYVKFNGGYFACSPITLTETKKTYILNSIGDGENTYVYALNQSNPANPSTYDPEIQKDDLRTVLKAAKTQLNDNSATATVQLHSLGTRWKDLLKNDTDETAITVTTLADKLDKAEELTAVAKESLQNSLKAANQELSDIKSTIDAIKSQLDTYKSTTEATIADYTKKLAEYRATAENAIADGTLDGVVAALEGTASTGKGFAYKIFALKDDIKANTDVTAETELKTKVDNLTERLTKLADTLKDIDSRIDNAQVDKTQVTITVQSVQRMYGEENPVFDYRVTGGTITGTPVISCAATKTSAAGTYPITLSAGTLVMDNVVLVNGTLTVTKAPLTVTTSDATIKAGDPMPTFTLSYSGFRNGDTESSLSSRPVARCETSSTQTPGRYTVTISGGQSQNYEFTYVSAQLTIEGTQPEGTPFKASDNAMYKATSTQTVTLLYPPEEKKAEYEITPTITYDGKTYTVNVIDAYAFTGNKILEKITIPATITAIGERAFSGCTNLKEITCLSPTPIGYDPNLARTLSQTRAASDGYIFRGVDKQTCILFVPVGCVEVYRNAPVWGEFVNIREIGSTAIIGVEAADGTDSGAWYDLRGRRLNGEPTEKGIYIHNGRKVVKR